MIIISYDRIIIRNCQNRLIILLFKTDISGLIIVLYTDISTEAYFLCILRSAKFKWIAVLQPVIWFFFLIAIFDLLLEHTITVADTTAVSCIAKRCQ